MSTKGVSFIPVNSAAFRPVRNLVESRLFRQNWGRMQFVRKLHISTPHDRAAAHTAASTRRTSRGTLPTLAIFALVYV